MDRVFVRQGVTMDKPVFDRIIDDFVSRLRESKRLRDGANDELEELLRRRELRPEHIKRVIFEPEDVQ
jgi:hypothetical protein